MLNIDGIRNPVWRASYNPRDPSVFLTRGGYELFCSRQDGPWGEQDTWSVAAVFTRDFRAFDAERAATPKGYASPGDVVRWHGRFILPFQSYPHYAKLCFSESTDGVAWPAPQVFLEEALKLPWNEFERAIDPTLVVDGDTLHCFFVGSCARKRGKTGHANLLGHAITTDPGLVRWDILTRDAPLLGRETLELGGVENVAVFPLGGSWRMIYSETLDQQRLAWASSADLRRWERQGPVQLPEQRWMAASQGAPFVWIEGGRCCMALMGTDANRRTSIGLLWSEDGVRWTAAPED